MIRAFQDPEIYRDILDRLQIGVSVVDLERKVVFWSDGAEQITGYPRLDVLGRSCTESILLHCNQSSCEMCTERCPVDAALREGQPVEAMSFIHHKAGYRTQVHVWAIPLRDRGGSIIGVIQTFESESAVRGADPRDRRLAEQGWLDDVTGLPNQAMMQSHLRETLGAFQETHVPFGIIFVEAADLDRFRARYGQGAARSILQVLARTLRNTVWPTDIVGRWSDEKFVVIPMGCSEEALSAVCARMMRMLASASIMWWGEELSVKISLGRAAARPGDTQESLLARAFEDKQTTLPAAGASAAASSQT
ncbi:MAG TPA: diguanylate cyclase [Candidatus Binatia bacterium]|nr:diguanylate cyclase [Candidatus Binatia bacterium]